ncbi:hypothetical protein CLOBOL_02432 [Enterocloster bolteae ATCC BAA-613]|uniref:Uncharacterized protein n=1 Tax=Enterocloster bolteae (strain ATCC BAA-613 / DSM 15670 / CCUG 46953 / JCM 12243 / WAL 16351) TaxID=411902 RepID=A8RPC7_ENTBW|nr:hypothetical protein CLOBOL_02432 [Enterocloster bolteae ATCC BAA-613]
MEKSLLFDKFIIIIVCGNISAFFCDGPENGFSVA